jgi:hypothetical protein
MPLTTNRRRYTARRGAAAVNADEERLPPVSGQSAIPTEPREPVVSSSRIISGPPRRADRRPDDEVRQRGESTTVEESAADELMKLRVAAARRTPWLELDGPRESMNTCGENGGAVGSGLS